ncbi:FtsX-like permease family protein [Chryseolinea soli]|uniref:FtsX-like permease family protein n=2 Tax=Chryseolinea soli TaxID=2321403 RepID=A0A385SSD0_9BACT|nr:FtsX-like permease family protein [Chryseolinea soli]
MRPREKKKTPPIANWLASKFINTHLLEEFFGDLEEIYGERRASRGRAYANLMHWFDVLHLIMGFASFHSFKSQNNPVFMYKHYLLITFRNLVRTKIYSVINILSLGVGMGVCLVICQYIYFELSYDRFHENYRNTYRVILEEVNTDLKETSPAIGYSFGVRVKEEIPEIKQFMRMQRFNRGAIVTNSVNQLIFHEEINDLLFVDPSFFQMFNYPLKKGTLKSLFNDKYNVVITEATAKKYFGADDPMGKVLNINGPPSPGDYTVTGVLEDLPLNSHLQFDFLIPMENYIELGWGGAVKEQGGWDGFSVVTYLTVDESANLDLIQQKLNRLIAQHDNKGVVKKVILQPIADIYMKSNRYSDPGFLNSEGNMQNIRIFSVISFFILFIAWANYINLSTARSLSRAKEVGVRKSIGAFKKQLISQFLFESLWVNLIAAIVSIGFAFLLLPFLNDITGKEIQLSLLQKPMFWFCFFAIILFGSLLSGLYPAFVLSSFKPISMLGANKITRMGNINLRKSLIVFQFLTSLLLISGTYLVYRQTSFMKGQELTIALEKILVLRSQQVAIDTNVVQSNFNSFCHEMLGLHEVSAVTSSTVIPGQFGVNPYRRLGQPESAIPYTRSIFAGWGFPETYGLKFIAGSSFTEGMREEAVVIINASALQGFGFDSPENAIHQKLVIGDQQKTIVGVVENFNWHSLREPHVPYVISLSNVSLNPYISVRMNMSDITGSLAQVESKFRSFYPDQPFEYFFAEDAFNRQYQSEVQFGKMFFSFAALAIFIACIGLFAMVSYSATLKVKEIGVRKVMGASTGNLMIMLSREYVILLLIANILAIPAVVYGGANWLDNYALRIDLGFEFFLLPGLALVIFSFITVSYRTYMTARTNPVESLRAE